jgi:hypothetical protein
MALNDLRFRHAYYFSAPSSQMIMTTRTQNLLFILAGVLIALALWGVGWGRARRARQDAAQNKTVVPEIVSCVKNIRVVKAHVENPGTSNAFVVVEVENTANIGIVAIAIEARNGQEAYTVTHSHEESKVVIAPHHTDTLNMAIMFPGAPIQLGGVMYEDGSEEGCDSALKTLHQMRDDQHKRSVQAQAKESSP